MTDTVVIAEQSDENTGYRFSWGLAIAGGVAATAVTFFLLTLGSGFGLLLVNPAAHSGSAAPAFLTGGAIYFFVAQAFGFAVGGHLAGRLLGPLIESRVQEDFRAAAHGLIAWAVTILATLFVMALAGLTAASTGATTAALYGATASRTTDTPPTAFLVDVLFRPAQDNVVTNSGNAAANASARAEAGRLVDMGLARGQQLGQDDHERLTTLVAAEAHISRDQAAGRIDRMQADIQAKTKRAADIARKVASYASLWIAASLLFGALVAMFAAIVARAEDDREAVRQRS
jgi:hypothetical protein